MLRPYDYDSEIPRRDGSSPSRHARSKGAIMQKTIDVKKRAAFSIREERSLRTGVGAFRYRGVRYTTGMDMGMGLMKGRAMRWFDRAVESQPLMRAVGSLVLGVFASLILPISNRERRLIEPAKSKVQENISQLGVESSESLMGAERPSIMGSDRSDTLAFPTGSRIPPVPPLDDLSTKIH